MEIPKQRASYTRINFSTVAVGGVQESIPFLTTTASFLECCCNFGSNFFHRREEEELNMLLTLFYGLECHNFFFLAT